MRETVLITGGAGFIGLQLARLLLADGESVVAYDNLRANPQARAGPWPEGLTLVEGDVRDEATLRSTVRRFRPRIVYHLAAIHYIPYCQSHPRETLETNALGTQAALDACGESVGRFVLASSAAVYSPADHVHREEDPTIPVDIYGLSKLFAEMLVTAFHRESGVPSYVARIFNVYGPGDTNPHVIPEIVQQLAHGQALKLGNLNAYRDFIHVTDVARALRLFLRRESPPFVVVNIGSGRVYSVAELVDIVREVVGDGISVESRAERLRPLERAFLQADIGRIRESFGWQPQVDFRDGIAELLTSSL